MATPPEDLATPIADEAAGQNRLRLVLFAALAVVLLGGVWFFFLRGGGEEPIETAPLPVASPIETPEPSPTDEDDNGPLETFDVFAAKDPFESAIDQSDDGGGEATGDGTTDEGTTDEGTDGGDTTPTGGDAGGGDSIGGHRVRVVDVFSRGGRAQIQVDGTVYTVDEGETFADNFQLVEASGECATMLFGDDEFTLCEGEEILK